MKPMKSLEEKDPMIRFRRNLFYLAGIAAMSMVGFVPAQTGEEAHPVPSNEGVPGLEGQPVELSLRSAVVATLAGNVDIRLSMKDREISGDEIWAALGIYDPTLAATAEYIRTDQPTAGIGDNFQYELQRYQNSTNRGTLSLSQLTPLGSRVTLEASETMSDDDDDNPGFSLYDQSYSSSAGISVRQPLLKDFGTLVTNSPIRISRRELAQSNYEFRDEVQSQLAAVMRAYWELVFELENLDVQRKALESARELERVNAKRVEVGALPRLSLLQAQAQVASRESLLYAAEAAVIDAQDALLRLMNWDRQEGAWNAPIQPTDSLSYYPEFQPNDAKALEIAQQARPDLRSAQIGLEIAEINRDVSRWQRLPEMDLFAGYNLSGLDDDRDRAVENLYDRDFEGYNVGVEFRYPLFNRQARARYNQSLDRVDQAEMRIENRELQILREVRAATRGVRRSLKQIEASSRQVRADQEKLNSEQKRLDVGERTIFDVLDFQDDLAESRARLARALADYRISLIELARASGVLLEVEGVQFEDLEGPSGWEYSYRTESDSEPLAGSGNENGWSSFLAEVSANP